MKYLKSFLIASSLIAAGQAHAGDVQSLRNRAETVIAQIQNDHLLNITLKMAMVEIQTVFINKDHPSHILNQYKRVQDAEALFAKDLRDFYENHKTPNSNDYKRLGEVLSDIDSYGSLALARHSKLFAELDSYKQYLRAIRNDLTGYRNDILFRTPTIGDDGRGTMAKVQSLTKDIERWIAYIDENEAKLDKSYQDVSDLIPRLQAKLRADWLKSFNKDATTKLTDIIASIDAYFLAERLTFEAASAALCINGNELSNAMYRYFNYPLAVAQIRDCQIRAYNVQRKLDAVVNFTPEQRSTVEGRLTPFSKAINKLDREVIGGGWQRMAQLQKNSAEKILARSNLPEGCKSYFISFQNMTFTNESEYLAQLYPFQQNYLECMTKKTAAGE